MFNKNPDSQKNAQLNDVLENLEIKKPPLKIARRDPCVYITVLFRRRKLHHKSTHFLLVSRSFLRRENILQYVHSWASSADGDIDEDDEEEFLDCDESFVGDNPVAREESVPKTNHQEEKLFFSSDGDVASVSTTQESRDTAVVTTVDDWCKQDSGFVVATTQPVGTSMSHEDQIGVSKNAYIKNVFRHKNNIL